MTHHLGCKAGGRKSAHRGDNFEPYMLGYLRIPPNFPCQPVGAPCHRCPEGGGGFLEEGLERPHHPHVQANSLSLLSYPISHTSLDFIAGPGDWWLTIFLWWFSAFSAIHICVCVCLCVGGWVVHFSLCVYIMPTLIYILSHLHPLFLLCLFLFRPTGRRRYHSQSGANKHNKFLRF